jgi:hypothetical protein
MLAGKTAVENTRPGNFIQLPSGQWVRNKPMARCLCVRDHRGAIRVTRG